VTIYNPSYFNTSGTGLTQTQANTLYLQKTVSDTATALETFSSGVAVNTIQPTSATGDMSIYPAQTGGNLYIGVNSSSSSGRTGTVHLADGNSMPVGANVHINNGTTNQSNTNIMNGATTSGTCNIMTGATTTGTVNICTGTSTGQSSTVHISDGTTTGAVSIGNTNNAVTLWNTITNLSYTTAPTLAVTNLGYSYRVTSLSTSSSISSGGTGACYSPSTGTTSNYLNPGTYTVSLNAYTVFSYVSPPTACALSLTVGIITTGTTTPSGITSITGCSISATKNDVNTNSFNHYPTFVFTVTTAGYYYGMAYISSVTMTGGSLPVVQASCQMLSLIRIA